MKTNKEVGVVNNSIGKHAHLGVNLRNRRNHFLSLLPEGREFTSDEAISLLGRAAATAHGILVELKDEGVIRKAGKSRWVRV